MIKTVDEYNCFVDVETFVSMKHGKPMAKHEDPNDVDRPRGVLSTVDRRWISGNKEYNNPTTESKRKATVHERIRNALYDLELLFRYPDRIENDRLYVGGGIMGTDGEFATIPAIAFLLRYRTQRHIDYDERGFPERIHDQDLASVLGDSLASAIKRALRVECGWRYGQDSIGLDDFDVTVTVDIEHLDPRPDHIVELSRGIDEGKITSERLLRVRDEVPDETVRDIFHFDDLLKKLDDE